MKLKPIYVFLILSASFLWYSFSIYIKPLSTKENTTFNKKMASDGQLVWQYYNCQSCHQLYNLGGYLGPDLTNVISNPDKGEKVIRAMVKSGTKQMPAFTLSDNEMDLLVEYLKSTDASGSADLRKLKINNFGMIEEGERK
ncbi:MAG: cytochrome c [Bacteroidota bacterium]|nr:cytochrome c [Bacteroidota bacterium]